MRVGSSIRRSRPPNRFRRRRRRPSRRPPSPPPEEPASIMDPTSLSHRATDLAGDASALSHNLDVLAQQLAEQAQAAAAHGGSPFVFFLTVFALACFVGYYVVWRVTPAL